MAFGVENLLALFAFLALIPLIIIYLIKPKPTKQAVPSLMFFVQQSKISKQDNFFRHFQKDWLFLLQLLIISLLAFAATEPFFTRQKDTASANTIFVLDVSASSHVLEDGTIRLDLAKQKIRELAADKNSLILIKNTHLIALQNTDKSELLSYLERVKAVE